MDREINFASCLVLRKMEQTCKIYKMHKVVIVYFSFGCGENWHDPVRCRYLRKWIKKCDDDSETSNWIAANTKVSCGVSLTWMKVVSPVCV